MNPAKSIKFLSCCDKADFISCCANQVNKQFNMTTFYSLILSNLLLVFSVFICAKEVRAHDISGLVSKVKPSVVGVGFYDALGAQQHQLRGSGFVFADGMHIATNYHVVAQELDPQVVQHWEVYSGEGKTPQRHKAEIIAIDPAHDLAILKIEKFLQPIKLASSELVSDATEILITGFPIGAVLGLYPATHKGIVAAKTPDAIPTAHSKQLNSNLLERLKVPFTIYQLDITAYPGNSGSAVYRADNGEVIGVINKVLITAGKESALENPTGISYAIPIVHLKSLAKRNMINL